MTIAHVVRWADNTDQLRRNIAEGLDQIEGMTRGVNKLATSLESSSQIAAHRWAAAIEKAGGATTLTAREQARANSALREGIEKYQALGKTAPAALIQLYEQTKPVVQQSTLAERATDMFRSSFVRLTAAFSAGALIERGVSTLISWGKAAFASAGQTIDLANKTGLSTRTIQEMAFVASQTGGTLEGFTKAAFQLGIRLAGGGASVQGAVAKLGLSFQDLQRLGPDEQFMAIVRALEQMKDPQQRNQLAVELFGKSAEQILPAIEEGYDRIRGAARIAGDAQLQAADAASDAWDRFVQNTKTGLSQFLGNHVITWQEVGKLTEEQRKQYQRLIVTGGGAQQFLLNVAAERRAFEEGTTVAVRKSVAANVDYVAQLEKARTEVAALTAEERIKITAAQKLGASTEDLTAHFGLSEGALKVLNETTKSTVKTQSEASKEAQRLREELRGLAAVFSGAKLAEEVTKTNTAIALLTNAERNNPEVIARIAKRASELSAQGAHLTGVLLDVWIAQRQWRDGMPKVQTGIAGIITIAKDYSQEVKGLTLELLKLKGVQNFMTVGGLSGIMNNLPGQKVDLKPPTGTMTSFADFFKNNLGGLVTGAFQGGGNVAKSLLSGIGSFLGSNGEGGSTVGNKLAGFLTKSLGANLGKFASSLLPGIGSLIGPLATKLFGGLFGKSKGALLDEQATTQIRDMQAELLKTHGSLDNIRRMGQLVGVDLAGAWGDRSQAGLKNFTALMDEFQQKQERLQSALERYGLTWKDLGEQARAAHLDQVATDLLADFDILKVAGVDVTTIVSGMSSAINQFLTDALTTGAAIPPSMQPMIEQLIRTGKLTEENAALLLGMQHQAVPAWADIKSAAERYGIALDSLGPKVEQIRIKDEAAQIVKDWELLQSAGADMGAVMLGMKDKVQGLVSSALKFGLELPESMRPMLQMMADAGHLTDETGERLTDLSRLDFAKPLTAMVDALIAKLDELINSIRGGAGVAGALDAVNGRQFEVVGRVRWAEDPRTQVPGGAFEPHDTSHFGSLVGLTGLQKHHHGTARILKFHSGVASLASDEVPAILQVGESVLNRRATQMIGPDAIRAMNTGRGGPGGVTRVDVRTESLEQRMASLEQTIRDQADRTYRAIRDAVAQGAA